LFGTRSQYIVAAKEKEKTSHGGGVEYLHCGSASRRRLRKGSLKSETIKYGRKSLGIQNRELLRWIRSSSNSKRQTRLLVGERAPHQQTINRLTVIKISSSPPLKFFIQWQVVRLTVDRKVRLILSEEEVSSESSVNQSVSRAKRS
jgi:hypothetical protein